MIRTTWSKPYINMKKELRKYDFKKGFFDLINNADLEKLQKVCEKTKINQTGDELKNRKLFGVETILSHNEMVFRKLTSHQNE